MKILKKINCQLSVTTKVLFSTSSLQGYVESHALDYVWILEHFKIEDSIGLEFLFFLIVLVWNVFYWNSILYF